MSQARSTEWNELSKDLSTQGDRDSGVISKFKVKSFSSVHLIHETHTHTQLILIFIDLKPFANTFSVLFKNCI